MTLDLLVRRSLRQHAFSTAISAASIALAGGLLLSVWGIKQSARQAFEQAGGGVDAVLGARGSRLQLVLSAVFHVDESPGNLLWTDYEAIRRQPGVTAAIPIATGDNYRGYRVVGTLTNLFTDLEYARGRKHRVCAPGRLFDPDLREAVIGSTVAARLGLQRGDRFRPYHGLRFDESHVHEESYLVVAVLEPSNTPADRVIWIPLAGVQQMSGHDARAATELSAVLLQLQPGGGLGAQLDRRYNRDGTRLTFAWPVAQIVARLFDRLLWIDRVLVLVAWLVAVVATGTILTTLYASLSERRRDLAILRALGAHRRTVFSVLLLEAAAITLLGLVLAFAVQFAIQMVAAAVLRTQTGVVLERFGFGWTTLAICLGLALLGTFAGLIPAAKAYRTDVASHLAPLS